MKKEDNTQMVNEEQTHDSTRVLKSDGINNAAPVSKKAFLKSPWASRAAFGLGGGIAGFSAGYATTAKAAVNNKDKEEKEKIPGLSKAATPDPNDKTTGDTADHQPEDENRLSNSLSESEEQQSETNSEVEGQTSQAHQDVMNHINEAHEAAARPSSVPAQDGHESQIDENVSPAIGNVSEELSDRNESQIEVNVVEQVSAPEEIDDINTDEAIFNGEIVAQPENDIIELEGTIPGQNEIMLENANGIKFAYVDDDMNFAEAFAAAREQVGAPGVFTWHGNTYGTYYAEEWNDMSVAERGDFIHAVNFPEELNNVALVETEVPVEPEPMFEIHVESITSVMDSEGNITTDAHITIDGIDTHFVDIDGDGEMDLVHVDIDGDGEFTPGTDAILPIDETITVDDVVEAVYDQNMVPDFDDVPDISIDDDLAMTDFNADAPADF